MRIDVTGVPRRVVQAFMTAILILATAIAVAVGWISYVDAPWTRDGRVRVDVANVTPLVSGQILELHVRDNQEVHAGQVLYVIDPFDFDVQLRSAVAQLQMRTADQEVKRIEAQRRQALNDLATSVEEKQQYLGSATMAAAEVSAAEASLAQAQINLRRTRVRSPVDGFVTNLQLRVGDYATASVSNVSIVDKHSFWIDGYFEENKLGSICVGDPVEATLIGSRRPIIGHVQSFGRGISVSDATNSTQGLPSVDPVYTWVRLAQRVPVHVSIDSVPDGVTLASGLTATVSVRTPAAERRDTRDRLAHGMRAVLAFYHLASTPARRCREPDNTRSGEVVALPQDVVPPPPPPGDLIRDVAPAMAKPPAP